MRTQRLTTDQPQPHLPPPTFWQDATPIPDGRRGHLQELDERGLADWATEHKSSIRLLARPGDYAFPGAPIALMKPPVEGADVAVNFTTALGPQRTSSSDLRALPSVNSSRSPLERYRRESTILSPRSPSSTGRGRALRDHVASSSERGLDELGIIPYWSFHIQ